MHIATDVRVLRNESCQPRSHPKCLRVCARGRCTQPLQPAMNKRAHWLCVCAWVGSIGRPPKPKVWGVSETHSDRSYEVFENMVWPFGCCCCCYFIIIIFRFSDAVMAWIGCAASHLSLLANGVWICVRRNDIVCTVHFRLDTFMGAQTGSNHLVACADKFAQTLPTLNIILNSKLEKPFG